MPRIHIVTDSSARFTDPHLWNNPQLTAVRASVRCGQEHAQEGVGARLADFHHLFDHPELPAVLEPPGVKELSEVYLRLCTRSDQVLSIHTAPAANPAIENARIASQQFLGRCNIQLIDSQTMSFGLGLLVEAALNAVERGASFEDVIRIVRGMIPRIYLIFFLDDLANLERHQLISRSQAILGNMLGIIAFLTMEDGRLIPMEKVRSRPRALEKLVEFVAEFSDLDQIAILQPGEQPGDESRWVAERLEQISPGTPISFSSYGPGVATLIGTHGLGVVVLESELAYG